MSTVIEVDLSAFFDGIRHHILLEKIARRIQDDQLMALVKKMLKVGGKKGVPQGGPFSPLAANIYLNELDWELERIRQETMDGALRIPSTTTASRTIVRHERTQEELRAVPHKR